MTTTVNPIDTQELDALIREIESYRGDNAGLDRVLEALIACVNYQYEMLRQLRAESDLDS